MVLKFTIILIKILINIIMRYNIIINCFFKSSNLNKIIYFIINNFIIPDIQFIIA